MFVDGIRPEWEDKNNKKGHVLSIEFECRNPQNIPGLLDYLQESWVILFLLIICEKTSGSEFVSL